MSQAVSPQGSIGSYTDAFDSSLKCIPAQAPHQNMLYSRRFVYEKGVDCNSDKMVLSSLKEQLNRIESLYKNKVNQALQNVYQRTARRKHVITLHNKWKTELEELWAKLKGDEAINEEQYRYIPRLKSPQNKAKALLLMMRLEMQGYSLKRTAQELILILGSQVYSQSLVFYKDKVKECEALIYKPTLEQKVDGLVSLFGQISFEHSQVQKRLEGKPIFVVEQTTLLFKELYEFIGYACTNFTKELNAGEHDIKLRLSKLSKRVDNALLLMPARQIQQQPALATVQKYLKTATERPLKQEDDFRNGMWLATTPYVGIYTEIQEEVAALRTSAKGLAALLETLQKRITEALEASQSTEFASPQHEVAYYNEIIAWLESAIDLQRTKLAQRPLSEKVHAGLYYVAKQLATASEVRMYIRQFTLAASGKIHPFAHAIGHLIQYLDPQKPPATADKHHFTSLMSIRSLYKAIRASSALANPAEYGAKTSFTKTLCSKAYTVISDTIASTGCKTVALEQDESNVPNMLFAKIPLCRLQEADPHAIVLPEVIRTYLMKGFIACLHLSYGVIDPKFEVALHRVLSERDYKDAFEETIHEDADFAELAGAYLATSDMSNHAQTLDFMLEVLSEIHLAASEDTAISRQRYYKITQRLSELAEQKPMPTSQQKVRLDWINAATQEPLKALEKALGIQNISSPAYALLRKSLFATQHADKMQARQELTARLQPANLANFSQDPTLYPLLERWAVVRFMSNSDNATPIERQMLHTFFVEYLSNQELREFWQSQYSIGAMEYALARFSDLPNLQQHSLLPIINRKRGRAHFDLYKQLTQLLATCTKANAPASMQKALRAFDEASQDPDGPWEDLTSHLSIARCLLNHMRACL